MKFRKRRLKLGDMLGIQDCQGKELQLGDFIRIQSEGIEGVLLLDRTPEGNELKCFYSYRYWYGSSAYDYRNYKDSRSIPLDNTMKSEIQKIYT